MSAPNRVFRIKGVIRKAPPSVQAAWDAADAKIARHKRLSESTDFDVVSNYARELFGSIEEADPANHAGLMRRREAAVHKARLKAGWVLRDANGREVEKNGWWSRRDNNESQRKVA